MKNNLLILSCLFILFFSCQTREKVSVEIDKQLDSISRSVVFAKPEPKKAERVIANINQFVSKYPADTLSPKYLLEAAIIYQKQEKYDEAIAMLDRVQKEYPDSKQSSTALFMQGFIYNNLIQDYKVATQKYELYLQKYSEVNSQLSRDIKAELQNIGKSPEEILKVLQEGNQAAQ